MGRTACTEPQCLYKGALYLFTLHFVLTAQHSKESILAPSTDFMNVFITKGINYRVNTQLRFNISNAIMTEVKGHGPVI